MEEGLRDLWLDEFVEVVDATKGLIGLCTLCANTGWIPERELRSTAGRTVKGKRQECICPNGRLKKKSMEEVCITCKKPNQQGHGQMWQCSCNLPMDGCQCQYCERRRKYDTKEDKKDA